MKKVLCVVPFYAGDRGLALRLGKWINLLSGGNFIGDQCLLVAMANTTVDPQLLEIYGKAFREVKSIRLIEGAPVEYGENPWPKAPNHQFLNVCEFVSTYRADVDAFYYLEPDNLPIAKNWWSKIVAEYSVCQKPLWGMRSAWIGPDQHGGLDAHHMIGTGIYPQNIWTFLPSFREFYLKREPIPWDAALRPHTNPVCYFSDLAIHYHQSRGWRMDKGKLMAMTPVKKEKRILIERRDTPLPEGIVIVHGCKDASLRKIYAEKLGLTWKEPLVFRHSGDLGDIVYGLASIRNLGGGILWLSQKGGQREPLTPTRMNALVPLLEEQPYLTVQPDQETEYVDYDFRYFRASHLTGKNLALTHAEWCGADLNCFNEAWLTVDNYKQTDEVIINRTQRYCNDLFPWKKILGKSNRQGIFVGHIREHHDFEDEFGSIDYKITSNLLEVAQVIEGSRLFVGNQSVCFAIAEGLKHHRIQETFPEAPDCMFESTNGFYITDGTLPDNCPLYGERRESDYYGKVECREIKEEPEKLSLKDQFLELIENDAEFAFKIRKALEKTKRTYIKLPIPKRSYKRRKALC